MKYFTTLLACVLFLSCSKDEEAKDFKTLNDLEIQQYLEKNNLNATKSSSGLYYLIESVGSGSNPTRNNSVRVAYKGYYTNGVVFDQSNASGISFYLNQVIPGWTEGLTYFKEGSKGKLFIPAALGYGNNSYGGIPGGSVLIFDISLIAINN